ncbi:hypothetical protein IL306_005274 [Fusarium sp. DS 682]|nr:hypothetical protein IL306_005274 [Fusarium sp. DS 682]
MPGANIDNSSSAIKPWQQRALARGRTPLPESPGFRPWQRDSSTQEASGTRREAASASLLLETGTNPATSQAETISNQGYKFWTQDEVKRLIELKREVKTWREIGTYHKRRAVAEEQMDTVAKKDKDQE